MKMPQTKQDIIGLITKINADKCDVKIEKEVVTCTMRGKLRHMQQLPLVGDRVLVNREKGQVIEIMKRYNAIRRPEVANVTQGLIVISLKNPDLDDNLLDKMLIELIFNKIKPIICLTKVDLLNADELRALKPMISYYQKICPVYFNDDLDNLKKIFKDQITVFMGQTGAGKSTLLNKLDSRLHLETGEISKALGRGRHTTRLVSLYEMCGGMVLDTPGFSSLIFNNMTKEELRDCYPDFQKEPCPYQDCLHLNEGECLVKQKVRDKMIPVSRYQNYVSFQKQTLKRIEKYKRKDKV